MPASKHLVVMLCSSIWLSSCASTEPLVKRTDAQWHVALWPVCPSEAGATRGTPAVFKALLMLGVDKLVDRGLSELARIAKEDVEGQSSSFTSSGYLWWSDSKQGTVGVASCAVISLSSSNPAHWCSVQDSPFKEYEGMCTLFEQLQTSPSASQWIPGHWQGTRLPHFYAEIKLAASVDRVGVLPRSVLYYYPEGLHGGKFGDDKRSRSVALTISTEKVPAASGPALGTLVATLKNIRPSPKVDVASNILPSTATGWVPVLQKPETPMQTDVASAVSTGLLPVNIKAEVREVGDTRKWLQATAEWLPVVEKELKQDLKDAIEKQTSTPGK